VPTDGNPIGGTAIVAGTFEWRQRFAQNIGGAIFVRCRQVSASWKPLPSDFVWASASGCATTRPSAHRFDVAIPRGGDGAGTTTSTIPSAACGAASEGAERRAFEIYIGLGQAFCMRRPPNIGVGSAASVLLVAALIGTVWIAGNTTPAA